MIITDRIRKVLQDNSAWPPPVSVDDFEAQLWLLYPKGNPEDGYIQVCLHIGRQLVDGSIVTFESIVRKRRAQVMRLKGTGEDKFIPRLNNWLVNGGLNEQYVEPNERARKRFPYER